jgi:two-component system phosphate regulon sensor histidine kinase PhoR
LWRIVLLLALASALGFVLDQITLFLLLALLAYSLHNLYNLRRLSTWLGDPQVETIPIHFGLWGEIYSRISRVAKRQAQREKRLSSLLNEYTASTSALPDAAVALDTEGRIRWFNDAASRLLGLQAAKDIGQPLLNLLRAPEMAAFFHGGDRMAPLQTAAPGLSGHQIEIRLAPYGEGQNLLLAQDITERLQHERMRKDFVANVSHELRTPLTVISGFIENLQHDASVRAEARLSRPLEVMGQQAERMRQIIEDLLVLARLESASTASMREEVDVAGLFSVVVAECSALREDVPAIGYDIRCEKRLLGDRKQLRSAVTNLVVNAVNHTPSNGRVSLSWSLRENEGVLEVTDDGEGIGREHIPRLTERFYRVDAGRSRERGGTGLGLAIVKHILNRHDAKLEIESRPGEGSRFRCVFPADRLHD